MSRFIRKKKEDIGLSPFALVFRGQKKAEEIGLHVIDFNLDNVSDFDLHSTEELGTIPQAGTIRWLNIDGLHEVELMEELARAFELDNNILSDVMNPSVRPKVQEIENGIFITIKMLQYKGAGENMAAENLSLIITDHVLISFQEQPGDVFSPVRERIHKHKNKIRTAGPDYLAFALLDVVVDNYIYILGELGEEIENIEVNMMDDPRNQMLDNINIYKRELNFLRKNVYPAKEMIMNLAKMDSEFIHDENRLHFRELQDNVNEAIELSESYREILYDQLNIYHTTMSSKLNDIMRVLTVFSVIFIPLTFIVGVYGTNFDILPEIHWHYGYFAMWLLMIVTTGIMLAFFRWKKWL
ncbi:MAG TPA: magnesium/cobalt transporter CorA [Paludibacter sp.]|nr:magnesium/cobalt transporter CorA [Paludibacter sp.]